MQDIAIEFAQPADLEAMTGLLGELFAQEADFRPDPDRQRRGLRLILDNPAFGRLFVLKVDGVVAGMANGLITVSTAEGAAVMILEDVVMGSHWRGRGLGRRLIEHVIDWAGEAGLARVTLLTDADNYRAQATYGRLGFSLSAMRVMRRSLG
jgi:GNAT superfamily N-acetyltransferase